MKAIVQTSLVAQPLKSFHCFTGQLIELLYIAHACERFRAGYISTHFEVSGAWRRSAIELI